jgi:hypothetical protein
VLLLDTIVAVLSSLKLPECISNDTGTGVIVTFVWQNEAAPISRNARNNNLFIRDRFKILVIKFLKE